MEKILFYSGVFIFGFVLISLWNFYIVTHPDTIKSGLTPRDYAMPFEEVTITSTDGLSLSGWLIEQPQETRRDQAIIILHGYPAEKGDMVAIASQLYPHFTLLLLDGRSFGESEGAATTFGIKERSDVRAAIDMLVSAGYTKIGVFGFSLGGAVGLLTAAEDERISAVATYGAFSDITLLGEEMYSSMWILKKPMVALMNLWSLLFFGESLREVTPAGASLRLTIPLFITHSQNDEQIAFTHALLLQQSLAHNKKAEFYFFEQKLHGGLPDDFYVRLKEFFIRSFE